MCLAGLLNPDKKPWFDRKERIEMVLEVTAEQENVKVDAFDGLLVDFARECGAAAILRGIRAISDYEYEFQMALMNRRLAPGVEVVFMMPAQRYTFVSSRLLKEVHLLGGEIEGLVPEIVRERL